MARQRGVTHRLLLRLGGGLKLGSVSRVALLGLALGTALVRGVGRDKGEKADPLRSVGLQLVRVDRVRLEQDSVAEAEHPGSRQAEAPRKRGEPRSHRRGQREARCAAHDTKAERPG